MTYHEVTTHYNSFDFQRRDRTNPQEFWVTSEKTAALHPTQFQVNEAWIVFQLNDVPISAGKDGWFNCLCLLDAASCYLLGTELIAASAAAPSEKQARSMLTAAWAKKGEFPRALYVPTGPLQAVFKATAQSLGMTVVFALEDDLNVFLSEARDGYREHMQSVHET